MNPSVALTTGSLHPSNSFHNTQAFASPMTEETIEKTSQRIQSSIRDVGIIARELLKGSRSEEVLMTTAKQFAGMEQNIESCALSVSKIELISQQLALHQECIEQALANVEDVEWKLSNIIGAPSANIPSASSSATESVIAPATDPNTSFDSGSTITEISERTAPLE
ncbi:BLOC-1-related complex subunit 7-like [Paramacrobiotus metropolitanus]|uniref:BLOC-1-related complex subunit 7-like n=1 Tax=Paramacrobiotus metropolitanus TaxID=2943436 RepID=UPI002445E3F6|nr:BLOC-1-related complex subunit 7-like [Paramacrobiotus metropolitanus]